MEQCVLFRFVCTGTSPQCQDGSDQSINICRNTTMWTARDCAGAGYAAFTNRCNKSRPGQCYKDQVGLDCIDTTDNVDDTAGSHITHNNVQHINSLIVNLTHCHDDGNSTEISRNILDFLFNQTSSTGLKCENKCIPFKYWCNPTPFTPFTFEVGYDYDCKLTPEITIDVREDFPVCHQRQFWQDKPCNDEGYTARCNGITPGQCHMSLVKCTGGTIGQCSDYSSRVCHVNQTYINWDGSQLITALLTQALVTNSGFLKSSELKEYLGVDVCHRDNLWFCDDKSTCVHHKLLCDGTPQCPDGSDESDSYCSCPLKLDEEEGPSILINRGISAATISCPSKQYPDLNLTICAVRCNSRVECLSGEDEEGCKIETIKFLTGAGILIAAVIAFAIFLVHVVGPCLKKLMVDSANPEIETVAMVRLPNLSDEFGTNPNYIIFEFYTAGHFPSVLPKLLTAIITTKRETRNGQKNKEMERMTFQLHEEENFDEKIQVAAALIQALPKLDDVESKSEDLFNLESKVHKKHNGQALFCLKNHMKTSEDTEAILKGTTPGVKDKLMTKLGMNRQNIFSFERSFTRNSASVVIAFLQMIFILLDYVKDFLQIFIILTIHNDSNTDIVQFFPTFGGQVLMNLCISFAIPVILFGIYLTANESGQELGIRNVKNPYWKGCCRVLTCILSPIAPIIIIWRHFIQKIKVIKLQEEITNDLENGTPIDMAKMRKLIDEKIYENRLNKIIFISKKNELVSEIMVQVTIQINLVFMLATSPKSLTVEGFQELFNDNKNMLVINILLSLKKIIFTNVGLLSAKNDGFLGTVGKAIKIIYFFLATVVRIGVVSLYFGVPIGLLNILIHTKSLLKYNVGTRTMVYDAKYIHGSLEIYKMNDTYTITEATNLTGLDLETYYFIFIGMLVVHLLGMTILKFCCFGAAFSKLTWVEKLLHIFHTFAFAEASSDWDSGSVSLEKYGEQWKSFKTETKTMLVVHFLENLAMVIPAVYTSINVILYHQSLPYTDEKEDAAYALAWWIMTVGPVVVVIAPLLQWALTLLYNYHGHPWKQIIQLIEAKPASEEEVFQNFWGWAGVEHVTFWQATRKFFSGIRLPWLRSRRRGGLDVFEKDPVLVCLREAPGFDQLLPDLEIQNNFGQE